MTRQKPRYKPGDRIGGRYQVHEVKMGGMGEVYLCLDLEEMYPYALKTFQQHYQSSALRRTFEQEVATWVALEKHPNIVRCFYMDTLDNQPFMVLEWIAGGKGKGTDLRGWLRHGPLDLKLALDITIDICRGMIHAQEKQPGLVHRDLKPENILVTQGGLAKITDFGLAQVIQNADLELDANTVETDGRQSLVSRKGIAGTPTYMAPEQWRSESLDARTDIYAIGCILYELLTGGCLFRMTSLDDLRHQHLKADISKLADDWTLPGGLDSLLARCLAKRREDRFVSVGDLLQQLALTYKKYFIEAPKTISTQDEFTASSYVNRGNTYARLKRNEEALADYSQAIQLDPVYATAFTNRGLIYDTLQHYEDALADHNRAIQLDPTYATAYQNRGLTYANLEQYNEALTDYNQAIELDPNLVQAYSNRGSTYDKLHRYDEALADYNRAILLDPIGVIAYVNRGLTYHTLQRYAEALTDYDEAIRLDPTNATVYYNRGNTCHKLRRYKEALTNYEQAIQLNSIDTQSYYNRGLTYAALQQYEEAIADYGQTIQLDPANAQAHNNRGLVYTNLQRYDNALADFDQAIHLDSSSAQFYSNRALVYDTLQQYDDAMIDHDQAIQLDPSSAIVYNNRGITYRNLQQYDKALADFDQAIRIDPSFAQAYSNLGLTYYHLKRYNDALADYSQVIKLDPMDASTYINRGITYAALQQHDDALADYNRAIQFDPSNALAHLNIGISLGKYGKLHDALPYLEQAAQLGEFQGTQYAAQAKQMLGLEAFQESGSIDEIQRAVTKSPFMIDSEFIVTINQLIAQQMSPEQRSNFEQRLGWLRQIAKEQLQ